MNHLLQAEKDRKGYEAVGIMRTKPQKSYNVWNLLIMLKA